MQRERLIKEIMDAPTDDRGYSSHYYDCRCHTCYDMKRNGYDVYRPASLAIHSQ